MLQVIAPLVIAGLGIGGYLLFGKKFKGIQVPPIMNLPDHPRVDPIPPKPADPIPQPILIGTTTGGNALHVIVPVDPDNGTPTVENLVATQGKAVDSAHALFDYLKAHGVHPNDQSLGALVTKFQTDHNTDPDAKKTTGTSIAVTGKYDLPTSATLTVYTGDPIPSDPTAPDPPVQTSGVTGIPVSAYGFSSSNLYAYLKLHGNDKTPLESALVKRFQHDVNTDANFVGPANPVAALRLIKAKLVEDGLYGKGTSDALAACTFERINP